VSRRLYLFEDAVARGWEPFAATRPAGELLFGALLMRERIERAAGLPAAGYLGPAELEGFEEPGAPSVTDPAVAPAEEERVVLCARYRPPLSPEGAASATLDLPREIPHAGARLTAGGRTVGWLLPPGVPLPSAGRLLDPDRGRIDRGEPRPGSGPTGEGGGREDPELVPWDDLPEVELPGETLPDPWTLVDENADRVASDLQLLFPRGEGSGVRALGAGPGVHRMGDYPVSVEADVQVEPGVVLDTRNGPIHLAAGVHVRALTRLEGPAYVGPGSTILGGTLASLSCGPVCKLHGEIDSSVLLGYVNKAHDGYLGHALVGRWVNLGAMTTNSDLKNTYGTVRVSGSGGRGEVETGLLKVGVFLGDHVKTGIGTLLNTGSIVGTGSSLVAGPLPPRWVPPFSWGAGDRLGAYRKESFLTTAERVVARRGQALPDGMRTLLARLWDRTHGDPKDGEAS
jgi:UDP-N-acetylglucosamine diphosphorylase / glucose-1-phosphate thymidylyltransferase / UDP-N-acetylgalactosamine diphosphorylase / glucosamine-1-phosphate N-acetyltransferase / galactosamine-1-phosphate N-acetyltransferase